MKQALSIFTFLFWLTNCNAQTRIIFHEYNPSTPDFEVVKWNISPSKLPDYYIQETADDEGRAIELKFNGDNSTPSAACGVTTWIKYEYPDDFTIIQYNLQNDGKRVEGFKCSIPFKAIYICQKI